MRPESVSIRLLGVFRLGKFPVLEVDANGAGIDDTWGPFGDVGPARRVGDLVDFALLGGLLAANHGVGVLYSMV